MGLTSRKLNKTLHIRESTVTIDWTDGADEPQWQRLAQVERIRDGEMHVARIGVRQVVVTQSSGRYGVFRNACPHAGAPLSGGIYQDGWIECPRHRWKFNVHDGSCPEHPLYSLRRYETKVEEGWIWARELEEEIW